MSSDILSDERVKWMRQRVLIALEIDSVAFDYYFTDSLERARSAGQAREELHQFLSETYSSGSAIFFSARKWNEDIEIEEDIELDSDEGTPTDRINSTKTGEIEETVNTDSDEKNAAGGVLENETPTGEASDQIAVLDTENKASPQGQGVLEGGTAVIATDAAGGVSGDSSDIVVAADSSAEPVEGSSQKQKKIVKVKRLNTVERSSILMGVDKMTGEMHDPILVIISC
jgi:hypothetical protein